MEYLSIGQGRRAPHAACSLVALPKACGSNLFQSTWTSSDPVQRWRVPPVRSPSAFARASQIAAEHASGSNFDHHRSATRGVTCDWKRYEKMQREQTLQLSGTSPKLSIWVLAADGCGMCAHIRTAMWCTAMLMSRSFLILCSVVLYV